MLHIRLPDRNRGSRRHVDPCHTKSGPMALPQPMRSSYRRDGQSAQTGRKLMRTDRTMRHPNVVHDPVGDAMGWLVVLFDQERGRVFEGAPEGFAEWEPITSREEVVNPERRWKGMGARYGRHGQHVAAGSHAEAHRAEVQRCLLYTSDAADDLLCV